MSDSINQSVPIVPIQSPIPDTRAFRMNGCSILLTKETEGWHISVARVDRDPTWAEIVTARYRLLPEVPNMVMHLPALWTGDYVNINPHCFHLYEAAA